MRIVAAIYSHPEAYPPTFNAITELSKKAERIDVVARNLVKSSISLPVNVKVKFVNRFKSYYEIENVSTLKKTIYFLKFTFFLWRQIVKQQPSVVILYDAIPLFSFYFISSFVNKKKFKAWYHNHDKLTAEAVRKYSVSWFAAKYEEKAFKKLDIFTLPAKERLKYFNTGLLKNKPYIIPNYPSLNLYNNETKDLNDEHRINLVYQGSLGPNHGFEEIFKVLKTPINGKPLSLTLLGKIRPAYKTKLLNLAKQEGVSEQLIFKDYLPLVALPGELKRYSIGLAIHKPVGITYSTGGTASNKIYEYIAVGLPVLLYDIDHYRSYLGEYPWAFFIDLKSGSLIHTIKQIDDDYKRYSKAAKKDFRDKLHFEMVFSQFEKNYLK